MRKITTLLLLIFIGKLSYSQNSLILGIEGLFSNETYKKTEGENSVLLSTCTKTVYGINLELRVNKWLGIESGILLNQYLINYSISGPINYYTRNNLELGLETYQIPLRMRMSIIPYKKSFFNKISVVGTIGYNLGINKNSDLEKKGYGNVAFGNNKLKHEIIEDYRTRKLYHLIESRIGLKIKIGNKISIESGFGYVIGVNKIGKIEINYQYNENVKRTSKTDLKGSYKGYYLSIKYVLIRWGGQRNSS